MDINDNRFVDCFMYYLTNNLDNNTKNALMMLYYTTKKWHDLIAKEYPINEYIIYNFTQLLDKKSLYSLAYNKWVNSIITSYRECVFTENNMIYTVSSCILDKTEVDENGNIIINQ